MSTGKVSKSQQNSVNRYIRKSYDRINLTLPKGERAEIQERARKANESTNGYITRAIRERMRREESTEKE